MSARAAKSPRASPQQDMTELYNGPHMMKNFIQKIIETCDAMMAVILKMEETGQAGTDVGLAKDSEPSRNQEYLRKKLKELIEMNVQWQTSFAKQEEKVGRLKKEITELQQSRTLSERQQADIDNIILAQKNKCSLLEDEKSKLEDENRRLRREVDLLQTRLAGLGRGSSVQTDVERVQMLEMQLATYVEDFERERRDRERAQGTVAELEQELQAYRRKPVTSHENYIASPWHAGSTPLLTSRSPWPALYQTDAHDGPDESDSASAPAAVASQPAVSISSSTRARQTSPELNEQDLLRCPKCRAAFTKDQHVDLMEHLERCA